VARRTIMINYATIFLLFASLSYLTQDNTSYDVKSQPIEELVEEFVKLNKESSFKESQKIVSLAEGGYSDDRKILGIGLILK
jgi:hypothetical protein